MRVTRAFGVPLMLPQEAATGPVEAMGCRVGNWRPDAWRCVTGRSGAVYGREN
jgi:hypothetical protein